MMRRANVAFFYRRISCLRSPQGSADVIYEALVSTFLMEQYNVEGSVVDSEV